jgi:hypothetical protein
VTLTRRDRRLAALLVVVHALVSGIHGVAHAGLPVALTAWQEAFVLVVPTLAPFAALVLLYRGHERVGAALLAASMAAALLFGLTFHYLVPNPDNVASIPAGPWHLHFTWTAAAIAVSELLGTALGGWLWVRDGVRGSAATAARRAD